nr:DUF1983 domain-containing protein [Enterobacter sp. E12]
MANTYKIREVTVTIPKIGIVSSDKEGNEFKCGEIYRINLFAMRPGWQTRTSDFDGLIVGRLDFSGYTESQCSRTQKIIMPNGYELVALRVGECGRPMTRESLPVVFSDAPLSDSEPFAVKNGEVSIKDAVIGNGIVSTSYNVKLNINNDGKEHAAGMTVGVEDDHSKVIFEADHFAVVQNAESVIRNAIENIRQSRAFEQLLEASQAQQAEALAAAVRDEVARQCQPGGSIWVQLRGR